MKQENKIVFFISIKCASNTIRLIPRTYFWASVINPLNAELNPICYLLALLGANHFLHVSGIRVKSLTLRLLMSYIYIYIYDISSLRFITVNLTQYLYPLFAISLWEHSFLSLLFLPSCCFDVSKSGAIPVTTPVFAVMSFFRYFRLFSLLSKYDHDCIVI